MRNLTSRIFESDNIIPVALTLGILGALLVGIVDLVRHDSDQVWSCPQGYIQAPPLTIQGRPVCVPGVLAEPVPTKDVQQ